MRQLNIATNLIRGFNISFLSFLSCIKLVVSLSSHFDWAACTCKKYLIVDTHSWRRQQQHQILNQCAVHLCA